jgi:hypothetical protein
MNESPERAEEACNILFFRPSRARYPAFRCRGLPSPPSAARFTPGYLSFARFAAQESRPEKTIAQTHILQMSARMVVSSWPDPLVRKAAALISETLINRGFHPRSFGKMGLPIRSCQKIRDWEKRKFRFFNLESRIFNLESIF